MGLELLEMVLEVERTFGIKLPDARASEVRTVGDLHGCIIEILGREAGERQLADGVFEKLRIALATIKGMTPESIDADTQLSTLLPFIGRRSAWRRLAKLIDLPLPPLQRPHVLSTIITVVAIPLGWIFGILAIGRLLPSKTTDILAWLEAALVIVSVFLAIFVFWLVGRCLTSPFAAFWPKALRTVGDLCQAVLESHYGKVVRREQGFNRDEVWCILQAIVAGVFCIDRKRVTPEARFVEDLGAG
jgi:acyl carrier protein